MKLNFLLATALILLTSSSSMAEDRMIQMGQNCEMVETISVGVNFNEQNIEMLNAKSFMDHKLAEIEKISQSIGITKLVLQNYNYSIYSNNSGCGGNNIKDNYQLSGNLSFQLDSAEKSEEFLGALNEKGLNINFNMSAYRQCQ